MRLITAVIRFNLLSARLSFRRFFFRLLIVTDFPFLRLCNITDSVVYQNFFKMPDNKKLPDFLPGYRGKPRKKEEF